MFNVYIIQAVIPKAAYKLQKESRFKQIQFILLEREVRRCVSWDLDESGEEEVDITVTG